MKRIDNKTLALSLLIYFSLTIFIPSQFISDGMGEYTYGFPFPYLTIYQKDSTSMWFWTNFFSGNDGLSINPIGLIVNIIVLYLIMRFIMKKFATKGKERRDQYGNFEV